MSNDTKINQVVSDAEAAFWAVVCEAYPEATTGDLSIPTTIALETMLEKVLTEWVDFNVK